MILKRLIFDRWIATFAMLFVVIVASSLGLWQVDRMGQKIRLAEELAQKESAAPLLAHARAWTLEEALHRNMVVKGEFLKDEAIWLDNRPHPQGRDPKTGATVGFYVLTPVRLLHSGQILWVNRGWAPRNMMQREALPELETPSGIIELEGVVFAHAARVMNLGSSAVLAEKTKIKQNLDLLEEEKRLGVTHLPFIVRQNSHTPDGLVRDWAPADTGADKHRGYAFQWFSLAALAVVFWAMSGLLRKKSD